MKASLFFSLLAAAAFSFPPPALPQQFEDPTFLGINNGTGFDTTPAYVDRSIEADRELGAGLVRMGMDSVGGYSAGRAFDFAARDVAVDKYRAAGISMHAVIAPRAHVERDRDYAKWKANFAYFVRGVMERYKGKIFYYIVDNEPDVDFGGGIFLSASQAYDFTKIAFDAARSIDPAIRIESPPVAGVESQILDDMVRIGIADVCDYIGVHAYGGQVNENRLVNPWRVLDRYGVRKPIAISESGSINSYCPGPDKDECRRKWFALFLQRTKRYGYSNVLLFDLDGNGEWALNPWFAGKTKAYYEVVGWTPDRPLQNGRFEDANDPEHGWVPFAPEAIGPARFVTFVSGDAAGSRGGTGHLRFEAGAAPRGEVTNVRRIAGGLPPGSVADVGVWANVTGGAVATLRALGYDDRDGDAALTATSRGTGEWEYLSLEVPVSRNWTVVELGTTGTGSPGDVVRFDDAWVSPRSAAPAATPTPPAPPGVTTPVVATPAPTSSPRPTLTPTPAAGAVLAATVTMEAEAPSSVLSGGARRDRNLVDWMGTVTFPAVSAARAGQVDLTVSYSNGDSKERKLDVRVNGVPAAAVACPRTTNWETVRSVTTRITLSSGANVLRLSGGPGGGPDLDKIVLRPTTVTAAARMRRSRALRSPRSRARRRVAAVR